MDVTYSSLSPAASLKGKTALVTGAARGMGRAVAEALDELGCFVLAVDRDEPAMRDLMLDAVAITEAIPMDVADRRQCTSFAEAWGDEPIHVMVNAAGFSARAGFSDADFGALWDRTLKRNLTATQNIICALLPALRAGHASVVNFCALRPFADLPGSVAVAASEGGLEQFTRALAAELGPEGLRVNALTPGVLGGSIHPAAASQTDAHGAAEDVIGPVLFLASAMSEHINGAILPVDGGYLARGALQ